MSNQPLDVIAAGHICIDIIPELHSSSGLMPNLYIPGGLVQTGPMTFSLGGSVANTGVALSRLGANVRAVGRIGDDLLGRLIQDLLKAHGDAFPEYMAVVPGEATSYSIVLSVPGIDRCFLHCPGANNTFVPSDVSLSICGDTRVLHFGYPPLMRRVMEDSGRGLATLLRHAQAAGALTSLDMAMPPEGTNLCASDWRSWLRGVLPNVDLFMPSFEEITRMLSREGQELCCDNNKSDIDADRLEAMADELIEFGARIVVIKLGDQGLYLQTDKKVLQLAERKHWRHVDWRPWLDRQLIAPCYEVDVVSSTGAGDCTIAGFLMAILNGMEPDATLNLATKVGAYSVQSADATSNIPHWQIIQAEIISQHQKRTPTIPMDAWKFCMNQQIYCGHADAALR